MHTSPLNSMFSRKNWLHLHAFSLAFLALLLMVPQLGAQTIPGAVIAQSKVLTNINGNAGHLAANTLGDAFYVSQTDNTAYWLKRGTTTPIALVTGLSGGRNVYVDQTTNNVYVPSNYSGRVIEVPYVAGTYATNTANSSGLPSCSGAPTAPCVPFGNGGAPVGYYYQTADLGRDAAGNFYLVDAYSNGGCTANCIVKFTPTGAGAYTASVVVSGLPSNQSGQIAVSPKGDVYYADGSLVYYIPAGATSYNNIGTGLVGPSGVTVDAYGNLYITDAGSGAYKIYEIPAVNGTIQPSKQFIFLPFYSANGIALDGLGHVFYTGYSSQTNLNQATINAFNIGSAAVGTAVSSSVTTLTAYFTGTSTLGAVTFSGTGSGFSYVAGSCAAALTTSAGGSCNFNVNYTPTAVGIQKGAVTLTDSSGNVVAVADLSGIGLGAAQTNDPGTITVPYTGLTSPTSVALDSSSNVYIADGGQNSVLRYASGSSTGASVGTGLKNPTSVAVDGAGNVYIADSGNSRVVKVPNVGGTPSNAAQSTVLSSYNVNDLKTGASVAKTLGSALSLATDLQGNLYVADMSNAVVVRLGTVGGVPTASAASLVGLVMDSTQTTYGQTIFKAPSAVTTDTTGDVFVADSTNALVTEITFYGGQQISIGKNLATPTGLATDAAGNLYIADPGNAQLVKVPYESPIYNTNNQYTIGGTIAAPYGVAADPSGNLYVVDHDNAAAYYVNRTQSTLDLGRANINTTTSQANASVGNAGNQTLTLGNPDYVATGNTTVFTVTSGTGGCANGSTIQPGFRCTLGATFSPTTTGSFSEKLAFNSNAVNTSTPSITLIGTGLNQAVTTTSLAQTSPTGTAAFGQPVVITATISSATAGTPTGTVIFFVDNSQQPKSYPVTNGKATITLTGLTGGPHTVGASYSGDNNFAPSAATVITITVARVSTTTTLITTTGNQNPPSATPGTSITFQATIIPNGNVTPTGTVTFSLNGVVLGTGAVAPNKSGAYVALFTTSALPTAANSVVATYSGDVNYLTSSTTLVVTITPTTFTFTLGANSLTVKAGNAGTVSFQAISYSGFSGYVNASCAGLPAYTTCGFNPNGFPLQADNLLTAAVGDPRGASYPPLVPATYGPVNGVLTVITGTTPTVPQPPVGGIRTAAAPPAFVALLMSPMLLVLRRRAVKKISRGLMLLAVLCATVGATGMIGCGSQVLVGPTPPGTYNVTITVYGTQNGGTATATTQKLTIPFTLVVQ